MNFRKRHSGARVKRANPESRDSGSRPSDHPGMTCKILSTDRPATPTSTSSRPLHPDIWVANPGAVADTGAPTPHCSRFAACPALPLDGPNTFQTEGCAVDGGLACVDADRGGCRPRGDARTERV